MFVALCQNCKGLATQTCPICGATVCIKCLESIGCKCCHGKRKG